jgi:hypothetical protein
VGGSQRRAEHNRLPLGRGGPDPHTIWGVKLPPKMKPAWGREELWTGRRVCAAQGWVELEPANATHCDDDPGLPGKSMLRYDGERRIYDG